MRIDEKIEKYLNERKSNNQYAEILKDIKGVRGYADAEIVYNSIIDYHNKWKDMSKRTADEDKDEFLHQLKIIMDIKNLKYDRIVK